MGKHTHTHTLTMQSLLSLITVLTVALSSPIKRQAVVTVTVTAGAPQVTPSASLSESQSQPLSQPTGSNSGSVDFTRGITYSPYNNDGSCKSQSQVASDLAPLSSYNVIRIYNTDCSQAQNVYAGLAAGQRIMMGIYNLDELTSSVQTIIATFQNNWDVLHSVTVGNEAVLNGVATVDQVVAAIGQVRSALSAAGYNGPIATVDAQNIIESNPQLCEASDFAGANTQAYFSGQSSSTAGSFTSSQLSMLAAACPGKPIIITESGWPTAGPANGDAVPSVQDQQIALQGITEAAPTNLILFTAYNDYWKVSGSQDATVDSVEPYFGIVN